EDPFASLGGVTLEELPPGSLRFSWAGEKSAATMVTLTKEGGVFRLEGRTGSALAGYSKSYGRVCDVSNRSITADEAASLLRCFERSSVWKTVRQPKSGKMEDVMGFQVCDGTTWRFEKVLDDGKVRVVNHVCRPTAAARACGTEAARLSPSRDPQREALVGDALLY
ncbi:MAG: hypothetical protein AAFQ82_26850, partial [Myxococcota bacterium]